MPPSASGPDVLNTRILVDIDQLDIAAGKFVNLLGIQKAAIDGLIVKQVKFNEVNGNATAVVEKQLADNRRLQIEMKNTGTGWEVLTSKIQKHTAVLTDAEKAARKVALADAERAKERAKYYKMIEDDKKPAVAEGGKPFLSLNDLSRIAEATLFKTALTATTNALIDGVKKAKDFQIEISLIRTVSQDAQISMHGWAEGIKEVSNALGIDLIEVSKAAYEAIQSQVVQGAQTFNFLKTAGELARTTGTSMKTTTDLLASTIQGFKLSVTEADHTAAVLFKTVELGRIQVGELSNTLGRVAAPAGILGIRLEEVGAGLSTLTRQGIKTSDANTLLTNVILKLAKPTENMKKLLSSWGFETGQAAVKTLGFVEVLRRLESTTEGRLGDLAELFNELRGLRGASGLTSAFKDYEEDLKKIDEADKTYKNAIEIRAESSADKITKFNNAAKNTFIVSYGNDIVEVIGAFVNALGKGDEAAKFFANTIITAGVVLFGFKAAALAFSTVQGYLVASLVAEQAATYAAAQATLAHSTAIAAGMPVKAADTVAQIARNKALAEFVPNAVDANKAMWTSIGIMAAVGIGVVGVTGIIAALNREIKQNTEDMSQLNRVYDETRKLQDKGTGKGMGQQDLERWSKSVDAVFKLPLKVNANSMQGLNKSIEENEQSVKKAAEAFSVSYKMAVEYAHDGVKKLNHEIEKSKTFIEHNATALRKMRESVDDTIRKTQYKYATDDQKRLLNAMNVQRLFRETDALFKKGDEQSVKAAQDKLKDIAQIYEEEFNIEQEMAKKRLEEAIQRDPSLALRQGGTTLSVSTVPLQQKLNDLLDYQEKKQKQIADHELKEIASKEKKVKLEDERLKKFEIAVKNYSDFSITDKAGKVDDKYLANGQVDKAKIQAELMRLGREVVYSMPSSSQENGNATPQTLDFYMKMMDKARELTVEGNLQANKAMFVQDQDRLTKTRDMYIQKYKDIKDAEAKFSAEFFSKEGTLDQMKGDATALTQLTSQKYPWIEKYFQADQGKQRNRKDLVNAQAELKQLNDEYQVAAENVRRNATRGKGGELLPRKEDLEEAGQKYQLIVNKAKEIAGILSRDIRAGGAEAPNPEDFSVMKDGKAYRLGDVEQSFNRKYYGTKDKQVDVAAGDEKIDKLKSELKRFYFDGTQPLEQKFPELTKQVEKEAGPAIKNFYVDLIDQNNKAIERVEKLRIEYEKLQQVLPKNGLQGKVGMLEDQPDNPQNAAVNPGGLLGADDAQYLATGGYVHPGQARGSDTIPAWLSPGEFIINAAQTKKFYSQLVDINRGVSPRYYARGGYVTTNVGDVHVHMEANSQPSASRVARQMGQELRREIRRGNVKLN